jgi:hypothetical protein
MNFHLSKKAKSDKKEGIGFEYPNEWTQSFATWTSNFRNFLITYRDIYKNENMGKWIKKHNTNVDQLISDNGFMVGFRYDMWVRQNAFAYKVTTATGRTSAVDIGVERKDIKYKAKSLTMQLSKLKLQDNPY